MTHEWMPIETAPRDGTYILLGAPSWDRAQKGNWGQVTCAWFCDEGSYEDGEPLTEDCEESPTHWMPLPPLPPAPEKSP